MNKHAVGIIGATGYAGIELVRLLLSHPDVVISALSSVSFEGKPIHEVYPALNEICQEPLCDEDTVIEISDVIFASLPHGLCEVLAQKALAKGKKFIDLGADFRLTSEADYKAYYGLDYNDKALHEQARYCIPELHRDRLCDAVSLIGNPGCYPTCIGLGLAPAVKAGVVDLGSIIIDAKSGTTGAGRGLSQTTHHADCNEGFAPYKVAEHRHTPEIEQILSELSGQDVQVTFVPHLLPVNRGIVATCYMTLQQDMTIDELQELYREFYGQEEFVRVLSVGACANLKHVKYSNFCDISLHLDARNRRLIVVSTIDNMVKGAAGQAIQNMNILMGFGESHGLQLIPPSF